ncbi:MFS transporter, partial [Candidatus Bathyarchaeota archaeon]|nr:MFS transporter [Candidatus Bathyarchaeota archaeon]
MGVLILLYVITFTYNYIYHKLLLDKLLSLYYEKFEFDLGQAIFYLFYGISILIGSVLSNKINRKRLLQAWIYSGIIINILLMTLHSRSNLYLLLSLTAFSIGFGLPSCFSYLVESTSFENRGRGSSIVQFLIFVSVFGLIAAATVLDLSLNQVIMLGIIIRVATLIPLHMDSFDRVIQASQPWGKVLGSKQTLLFLIPWVLISLNNGVLIFFDHSLPSSPEFEGVLTQGSYIMFIGISVFGLISGFMADRSGRKQPLILGAMALGISYALVGISTTPFNLMLMMILSGAGWGFVTVILQWVVFGDLAPKGSEEKYYVLALVVYPV